MATKKARQVGAGDERTTSRRSNSTNPPARSQVRNKFLAGALDYARRGLAVFPLTPGSKIPTDRAVSNLCEPARCRDCPHYAGKDASNPCKLGKEGGHKVATTDEVTVKAWWARAPEANVALAAGASKRVIFDCDSPDAIATFALFCDAHDVSLGDVPAVNTPRTQGRQYQFVEPPALAGKFGPLQKVLPGVDVRAGEAAAMLPPSYYKGKRRTKSKPPERSGYYEWHLPLDAGEAVELPPPLAEFLIEVAKATKAAGVTVKAGEPIPETTRDVTLTSMAGAMRRKGMTAPEILAALREVNKRCDPPLPDKDLDKISKSIGRKAPGDDLDPLNFHRSDTGNAEYFERLYEGQVKYDHRRARWLIKDTHFWAEDKTERIRELAVAAMRTLHRNAVNLDDADLKKKITAHAIKSENEPQLRRLLECARSKPGIRDAGIGWDAKPELLGTPLGVVDLRTGRLRDANADDKITRVVEHYDPTATAPRWERFLKEIFPDSPEFQTYIEMAVGYSLTGYTTEKCFFFCYGPTNTGKSTFLEAILNALGEYADAAPFEVFTASKYGKGEGASPFSVAMAGRRFIKSMEPPTRSGRAGVTFNEGMIKELTGADRIKIRDNYGKPFTLKVTYHIWFGANDRPDVRAEAEPVWNRVRPIPFDRTFDGDAADTSLNEKLAEEGPGILNCVIRGAVKWWAASNGGTRSALRDVPAEIREASEAWRTDTDLFAAFLKDECIASEGGEVSNERLYKAYRGWWAREGLSEGDGRFLSSSAMGRRLAKEGYERGKTTKGARCWRGIDLKSLYDNREPDPLPEDEAAEF